MPAAPLPRRSQVVPMLPTLLSACLITAQPSPHWPPGLSLPITLTTRLQGHTTPTPVRLPVCTRLSPIWAPPRGPCTLPSPNQPVYPSRTAPRTGNSQSTQPCRGHDREQDQRAPVPVQAPCQTPGAAASAAVMAAAKWKAV